MKLEEKIHMDYRRTQYQYVMLDSRGTKIL